MSAPDRLDDEALDGLLDGSPPQEAVGTPLAAYLAELRGDAQATTPTPSEELSVVLAEGLDPAELETAAPLAAPDDQGRRGILTWRRRARTIGRVLVTKFAALGLLGKAVAAGAAVTVAASGAGAAGVLPEPAQETFDDAIGREVQEAPDDAEDEVDGADATQVGTPPETPANTSTTPPLETDVPDDATGADGEPGVDGRDIAEDASEDRSGTGEQRPDEESRDEAPAGPDRGDQDVQDAPTDDAPLDVPPSDPPSAGEDAPQDGAEDRPAGAPSAMSPDRARPS